ncbi:WD40 repeat-like protein [Aspergillus affinis]|uniref:WD40 repeat-like protein n=1 Tax=Aspergillus affinis TaxID=1070780 RepID=UPI0022FF291A|nr:WD40 repeat-like protein [Aspergillus affinis]KAI9035458.1 WD40 repeat-like protein [Aspergillus affinis]
MQHLRGIDPRTEIRDIEERREKSVRELYGWVLDTEEYKSFVDWENPNSPNLLWINGQAGTGKTMLSVGLIQELLASNLSGVHDQEIVYFLNQDTEKELNEGAAVLRALMWLLLVQNPGLARHLRPSYEESGSALFNDPMAFTSLLPISNKMANDNELGQVDLLIDALDKCKNAGEDVFRIMKLIPTDGTPAKVKILVTSRPLLEIDEKMKNISASSKAVIRLDDHSLSGPITIYIDQKRTLFEGSTGDENLVNQTIDRLKGNTGRTFL